MILRFGTLDLIRGDYRRYQRRFRCRMLKDPVLQDIHLFENFAVSIEENENRLSCSLCSDHLVFIEKQLNNNNNIIRQNEQSIIIKNLLD